MVSGLLLLLIVVVLALVLFIDVSNTVLVLSVLVACLIVVGISACIFLEWMHRRALRRRDEGAKAWIHHTIYENKVIEKYWRGIGLSSHFDL
jgi:predicted membrane chloride channel (bestrophin family)